MTWKVQKRERFLHAVALYCSRMKKTLPDLEFLSIPPVLNLAPVLHAIEITTPERRNLPLPELV